MIYIKHLDIVNEFKTFSNSSENNLYISIYVIKSFTKIVLVKMKFTSISNTWEIGKTQINRNITNFVCIMLALCLKNKKKLIYKKLIFSEKD